MELADKNILIVGLGKSGAAAARFLKKRGAKVTVTDMTDEQKLGLYLKELDGMNITMELGQHRIETFEQADLIVVSPGVPHTILPIKRAMEKGVAVVGEVELASRFIKEPVVAVTGTNGKTTTTKLLGEMLENSGIKVFVGGNIGNPLINYVEKEEKAQVIVAEISSFQLDTIDTFRPKVSVLLNITKDHLDRYPDFDAYVKAKGKIFENQREDDTAVLNGSDPLIRLLCENIKAKKVFFSCDQDDAPGENGKDATVMGKKIIIRLAGNGIRSIDLSCMSLRGRHNKENISAACLAALAAGGTFEGIEHALKKFKGLSHRLEYVLAINGASYFNDSKATNVDAVARALESFSAPVILIMGGRDKDNDFSALGDLVRLHAKKLIVMGETSEKIKSALACLVSINSASSMEGAVFQAYREAVAGDIVLLSPACSSFDMYNSYAERGEHFCRVVKKLK